MDGPPCGKLRCGLRARCSGWDRCTGPPNCNLRTGSCKGGESVGNPIARQQLPTFATIACDEVQCWDEQTLQDFAGLVTVLHSRDEQVATTTARAIVVDSERF